MKGAITVCRGLGKSSRYSRPTESGRSPPPTLRGKLLTSPASGNLMSDTKLPAVAAGLGMGEVATLSLPSSASSGASSGASASKVVPTGAHPGVQLATALLARGRDRSHAYPTGSTGHTKRTIIVKSVKLQFINAFNLAAESS